MPVLHLHRIHAYDPKTNPPGKEIAKYREWLEENVGEYHGRGDSNVPIELDLPEGWYAYRDIMHVGTGWEIYAEICAFDAPEQLEEPDEERRLKSRRMVKFYVDITDDRDALMFSMKHN